MNEQNNNALARTQYIDHANYVLTFDGLVDHPLKLSYADLLAYPQISQLTDLNCVEGWSFTAKWTGRRSAPFSPMQASKPRLKSSSFIR